VRFPGALASSPGSFPSALNHTDALIGRTRFACTYVQLQLEMWHPAGVRRERGDGIRWSTLRFDHRLLSSIPLGCLSPVDSRGPSARCVSLGTSATGLASPPGSFHAAFVLIVRVVCPYEGQPIILTRDGQGRQDASAPSVCIFCRNYPHHHTSALQRSSIARSDARFPGALASSPGSFPSRDRLNRARSWVLMLGRKMFRPYNWAHRRDSRGIIQPLRGRRRSVRTSLHFNPRDGAN
jgi:hypothetical protein